MIEEGYRTVAIISPVKGPGRPIDQCIALAEARSSGATLDENFAEDLEEIIAERKPLDTSAWDYSSTLAPSLQENEKVSLPSTF